MAWVFSLILHNMERRIRKLIRVSAITVGALLPYWVCGSGFCD
mgnify:CR=1 FL=1